MTPQEQYPKFFSHPHYWIDAIEVECVEYFDIAGIREQKAAKRRLSIGVLYHILTDKNIINHFAPIFKPQEGEAFIKDLEVAVSAGLGEESITLVKTQGANYVFVYQEIFGVKAIEVYKTDLSILLPYGISFNCAAYTDKLRELGYYV